MTESEWNTCEDALVMLRFLHGRSGERKLRLLACACARSHWQGLVVEEYRLAVEIAERFADGVADLRDLRTAWMDIFDANFGMAVPGDASANNAASACIEDFAGNAAEQAVACMPSDASALVREILGNPFQDVVLDLNWETTNKGPLKAMAESAYNSYQFENLPLLADTLDKRSCRNATLLAHLRSPGPHYRGCWALDLLLGKGQGKDLVTESDWRNETHPFYMLNWWKYFRGEPSPRKRRLLACACCRLIWHLFAEECLRQVVNASEAFADGLADPAQLERLCEQAHVLGISRGEKLERTLNDEPGWRTLFDSWRVTQAAALAGDPDDVILVNVMHHVAQDGGRGWDMEDCRQAALIRDILGSPLRQVSLESSWKRWSEGTVAQLAWAIYEERSFDRLPVLADALEEAGCTDTAILTHLRQPGPHARGCWAVDILLGKD